MAPSASYVMEDAVKRERLGGFTRLLSFQACFVAITLPIPRKRERERERERESDWDEGE